MWVGLPIGAFKPLSAIQFFEYVTVFNFLPAYSKNVIQVTIFQFPNKLLTFAAVITLFAGHHTHHTHCPVHVLLAHTHHAALFATAHAAFFATAHAAFFATAHAAFFASQISCAFFMATEFMLHLLVQLRHVI